MNVGCKSSRGVQNWQQWPFQISEAWIGSDNEAMGEHCKYAILTVCGSEFRVSSVYTVCVRWVRIFFRNWGAPTCRALASACSPTPTILN